MVRAPANGKTSDFNWMMIVVDGGGWVDVDGWRREDDGGVYGGDVVVWW